MDSFQIPFHRDSPLQRICEAWRHDIIELQFPFHRDARCTNLKITVENAGMYFQFPFHRDAVAAVPQRGSIVINIGLYASV